MPSIKYDIDKTEDNYISFEGNSLNELKNFLYPDNIFYDCCGYITYKDDTHEIILWIASLKKYGVYLGISNDDNEYLSLSDISKLNNLLDVWGDGLYVSEGLFISPSLAWEGICAFVNNGHIYEKIDWITSDELPKDANFII